jgi:hypothetical protein
MPEPIPAEAVRKCQAWDIGYSAVCPNRARWKAEKPEAVSFVLCGRHLHRAWRSNYKVSEIGAPDV